jgi:hypothetical protein
MTDLRFDSLSPEKSAEFLKALAPIVAPARLAPETTKITVANLDFYQEYKFYVIADTTLPAPNERYALAKGNTDITVMHWTNEPIYKVNELAPIILDRKTVIPYAKFFFHYVRGQLGRFIIVEKPEDVRWLPNANDKEKADVAAKLMPVTYKGIGRDNLFTLTATVIFKNALFKTDIKIAPDQMEVFDADLGMNENFTLGQMKLTNEELLLEDLNVPVDPPPGEFG